MEFKDYIVPLKKWWWLILIATLVAAGFSYFAVSQQPNIYQARAKIMIGRAIDNPNPTGNEFFLSQQLASSYAEVARTGQVRRSTMEALGMNWLPNYGVRSLPNTQLIEIAVTDTSPERAAAVANELANQIILQSPTANNSGEEERQEFIDEELDDLEAKIRELRTDIAAKQEESNDLVSAQDIQEVQNQIDNMQIRLSTLQSNYAALLSNTRSGAINSLNLIDPAEPPDEDDPIGPDVEATVFTAAAIGFILSAGAAYLLEFLDDTVKTPDDVQRVAALPTLAGIARLKTDKDQYKLITREAPRSPVSEAFRVLRTGIQFANVDKPIQTLLVTSSNPSEGKSLTAANLAVVMAQSGQRVLLIDADLRRPVQHKIFDLVKEVGLTKALLALDVKFKDEHDQVPADIPWDRFIQKTDVAGLDVMASGNIPPNPSELLGSTRMKAMLNALMETYHYILIDSPPVLAVTDASILSTIMDGVLLISDAGKTRRAHLGQTVERLREVKGNLIGVTLNRLSPRSDGYSYYYYYRSHYYQQETEQDKKKDGQPALNGKNGKANGQGGLFSSLRRGKKDKDKPQEEQETAVSEE